VDPPVGGDQGPVPARRGGRRGAGSSNERQRNARSGGRLERRRLALKWLRGRAYELDSSSPGF